MQYGLEEGTEGTRTRIHVSKQVSELFNVCCARSIPAGAMPTLLDGFEHTANVDTMAIYRQACVNKATHAQL
jgi:hypothetical protein